MTALTTAPFLAGAGRVEHRPRSYPGPGPGQLLVRPRANALCGSDAGLWRGGSPVVAGHEAAGTVVAAGRDTTTPVGTRGVIYLMAYCGRCRSCRAGATNLCLDKAGDMGFNRDGGLGPLEVVEERMFFPIGDDLPFPLATMLLDVMGTSGAALNRALSVRPGIESLLITGAGPVGLGVLAVARLRLGADVPIHISDVSEWRLAFAESLGGIPVHARSVSSRVAGVPEVDAAVDASGRAGARRSALDRLSRRGVLVCVGHGEQLHLDVSPDLISTGRAVLGSEYFPYADLPAALELLRRNTGYLGRIVTHTFDVSETGLAFETFLSGESGKVVVTQDGE
ncbi:alcohol dehydrogenase [Nonomuraea deserti]|uniref:Alcohol dehydrogenase n=1 Tax=Nonomuraea deserti TaxID=1848322 RepID=A0A4R4W1B0_9ACTN|nr:alcohol dehydrogenase catalytic domain-containing protein [Nonomuraea deserti]TDD12268.1 alcohol dehydrogenase [Nonomuraea deserti]